MKTQGARPGRSTRLGIVDGAAVSCRCNLAVGVRGGFALNDVDNGTGYRVNGPTNLT